MNELKPHKCDVCGIILIEYPEFANPANYVEGKKISDFKVGELFYIKESKTQYEYLFLCEFVSYKRGNVTAKIVGMPERHEFLHSYIGKIITAKPMKCALYERNDKTMMSHFHWFRNGVVE